MRAKMRAASKSAGTIDWNDIENNLVTQWYFVSKIMHTIIPKSFPYFTFVGLVEEINKDPNYKPKEDKS